MIARFAFEARAPQDIAWDGRIYYVTSFLDPDIHRYSPDLLSPLPPLEGPFQTTLGLTGIAFNQSPVEPGLFVMEPVSRLIREIDLEGRPTGREIAPLFESVVNPGYPLPRGMAFDPSGDGGRGSLYIAEAVGSLIYEVSLDGEVIRLLTHPDDPDGFPGRGLSAPLHDVDLLHDSEGKLTGILAVGGRGRTEWIRRLEADGGFSGFSTPLVLAGGSVAGFLVRDFMGPGGERVSPALIVTVESSAELVVLDGAEIPIGEIYQLSCTVEGRAARFTWKSGSPYDVVELYRDCRLVKSFPGDPGSAREEGLGPGVYRYRLRGYLGNDTTESAQCTVVIGGGQILRTGDYDGGQPVDLAVDGSGLLYLSDYWDRKIYIYDEEFTHLGTLELPFLTEEDRISGIAFSPAASTLFVYNSEKNNVVEIDLGGNPLRTIAVPLPNDPEEPRDKPLVVGMTFDPRGGSPEDGLLWFVELRRATVYALDLKGQIASSFLHPVARESPVPPLSAVFNFTGGLSEAPGPRFDQLDLSSGTVFERDVKRIIRVDARSGEALGGWQLPLDGQDLAAPSNFVSIQHAVRTDGKATLYVVAAGRNSQLLEMDPTIPEPRPITRPSARQRSRSSDVLLSFHSNDAYQRILVDRDCRPLKELGPGDFSEGRVETIDPGVPPGLHRYDVRGVKDGVETPAATAEVQVGPGAILARVFAHPLVSPVQLTRDPADGSFLLTSNSLGQSRSLFRYRADLSFEEALTDVIPEPWEMATVAVRPLEGQGSRIYALARNRQSQIGAAQTFPLYVLSRSGELLEEHLVEPPSPPNGFVTYPTGLSWDGQVFYYLERNSDTIVRMDAQGKTLALIRHPAPPLQSFVFNLGLSVDPENGALLVTGAGPADHRITKAIQLTREGRLTGLEFPLGHLSLHPLTGIAADGADLIACGLSAVGELMRVQMFDSIPPPADLSCSARGPGVLLTWRSPGGYDQTVVLRDGSPVALLPGDASSYEDLPGNRDRPIVYSVAGRIEDRQGKNAFCELEPPGPRFIRGDSDGSGQLDLTDGVLVLSYLFLTGPPPACSDAADADDSGELSITDPIRILGRLFLGDGELPPPYPEAGQDPTQDRLGC